MINTCVSTKLQTQGQNRMDEKNSISSYEAVYQIYNEESNAVNDWVFFRDKLQNGSYWKDNQRDAVKIWDKFGLLEPTRIRSGIVGGDGGMVIGRGPKRQRE